LGGEHLACRDPQSRDGGAGVHFLNKVAKMVAFRLTQTGHYAIALGFIYGFHPSIVRRDTPMAEEVNAMGCTYRCRPSLPLQDI
jgi:hypothetical protein